VKIEILGCESSGARSLAGLVKTGRRTILLILELRLLAYVPDFYIILWKLQMPFILRILIG